MCVNRLGQIVPADCKNHFGRKSEMPPLNSSYRGGRDSGAGRTFDGHQVTHKNRRSSPWREAVEAKKDIPQPVHRGERPPSDSHSLSPLEYRTDLNEKGNASAKQPVDKVEKTQKQLWPMGDPMKTARAAYTSDLWTFDVILDATEDKRKARLLRMLIAEEQARIQMARLAEPEVPDVCIEEALSRRPILYLIRRAAQARVLRQIKCAV